MKKQKNFVYRIKDLNTGLYYSAQKFIANSEANALKPKAGYTYSSKYRTYWAEGVVYLYLNSAGRFYPTAKGAAKMISQFTASSIHDRKTKAGILLNAKFPFVVVKSELKLKDVVENETKDVRDSQEVEPSKPIKV